MKINTELSERENLINKIIEVRPELTQFKDELVIASIEVVEGEQLDDLDETNINLVPNIFENTVITLEPSDHVEDRYQIHYRRINIAKQAMFKKVNTLTVERITVKNCVKALKEYFDFIEDSFDYSVEDDVFIMAAKENSLAYIGEIQIPYDKISHGGPLHIPDEIITSMLRY